MEMHQIRYFLAVAEQASFSRAAERCRVSQPALTTAIKKLEEEVGGPVFHREGRRVALSELGRMLKPHLTQVLSEAEAARDIAKNFRLLREAPLRVGVLPTIGPVRLARFLDRFRRDNPGIELAVHEAGLAGLIERLDKGELDLALMASPGELPGSLKAEALYRERYMVVFQPGHRFETLNAVRLADVDREAYVDRLACEMREMVMGVMQQRRIELYAGFRSEREDWVQAMVAAGLGFAFMPEYSMTITGVLARPLVEPDVARMVSLVEVRGRPRSPAAQLFAQGAKAHRWPG